MKRNLFALLSAICIFCSGMTVFAANGAVTLYINSYMAYAGGEKLQIDPQNTEVAPLIENGRTMVPVRFVCEAFGGAADWDEASRTVTLSLHGKEISAKIGENVLFVNGERRELDVPVMISEGRTLLPLRAVSNALDKEVLYEDGFIAIGTADEVKNAKASVNIAEDFKKFMIKKPVIIRIYKRNAKAAMPGFINGEVSLNGKKYRVGVSQSESAGNARMTFSLNGINTDTTDRIGFCIYDMYLADINPRDGRVELFVTALSENGCVNMAALSFDEYSARYLDFEYCTADSMTSSQFYLAGQPETAYGGINLSENGEIIFSHSGLSGFRWGLEASFRLENGIALRQRKELYYKVDSVRYLASFAAAAEGISDEERAEMKDGYVLCGKAFGFIDKGDYFTVLFDDDNGNIYCLTRDGKSGWIHIESADEYAQVNKNMFLAAG